MANHIGRRKFLATLGGATVMRPLAARAQQAAVPVVGFLDSRLPDAITDRLRGFRQGLKETGYVDGENVAIDYRFAENRDDRSRSWQPSWFAARSPQSSPEVHLRHSRPRRRPPRSP
jgi:hypothetical protein